MTRWMELAILTLATIAAGCAVVGYQQSTSAFTRWGTRASLVLSLSMIVGTLPAVIGSSQPWLRWTGSILSIVLTVASLTLLRRQLRSKARSKA